MKAEIITIGDELLIGQVIDSNSAFIAHELNKIGIAVCQITSVSDCRSHILSSLKEASVRAKLVIVTGGLGPTNDDVTKSVLAEFTDDHLTTHDETLYHIADMMSVRGLSMNSLNKKQAELPSRCVVLRNNCGTAPGMWFEKDGVVLISLPGVPFEMKTIMQEEVLPRLRKQFICGNILHRTISVYGIPESELALQLESWENSLPHNIRLAYLPGGGFIRLRLSISGSSIQDMTAKTEKEIEKLKSIIPPYQILSETDELIEEIIARILTENRQTVAIAESCTGGNIASLLTTISGSSAYFKGSVVAYSNEVKEKILYVDPSCLQKYGAVSEETAMQMATNVRQLMNADYGVATTGIAGPTGGTPNKPVGTIWIAVSSKSIIETRLLKFGNNRENNIQRTTNAALMLLKKIVLEIAKIR